MRVAVLICAIACSRFQGAQGVPGVEGLEGPTGPHGADGATGVDGATGPRGDTGATGLQGPPGPTLSVVDSSGARLGTLLTVSLDASGNSHPLYRDDAGRIWSYLDEFGSLPPLTAVLYAQAGCAGDPYTSQTHIAGLVVQHLEHAYAVGASSLTLTVASYSDSGGTCRSPGEPYATRATSLEPLGTAPDPPSLPFAVR